MHFMQYRHHHGAMNVVCFTSLSRIRLAQNHSILVSGPTFPTSCSPLTHAHTSFCMSCLHCRKTVPYQCTQSRKLTTLQEADTHKRQLWNPFLFQAEGPTDKSCSEWQYMQARACRLHPLAQKSSLRWQGGYSGTGSHWDRKHNALAC